jgi:hypothetical protein
MALGPLAPRRLDKISSYPVLGSYHYTEMLGLSFRAVPEKRIGRRNGVGGAVEQWSGGVVE